MRASEAAVGVEAVVKGLAVDTEDMGLQVALLGGAVGAVPALEWFPSWERQKGQTEKTDLILIQLQYSHHCGPVKLKQTALALNKTLTNGSVQISVHTKPL